MTHVDIPPPPDPPPHGSLPAWPPARRRGRPQAWAGRREELLRRIAELRAAGRSVREIGRTLGIAKSTVATILNSLQKVSDNS